MGAPNKTCATCDYAGREVNPLQLNTPVYVCRRHPPTLVVSKDGITSTFPPTRLEWRCGEYRAST